ncbi:MAG: tetratricopeptide repeat protein [Phycisphaerae bacterium]|nr:tetratricopeptide repeat protein [Phycisphaerae bacterium]
MKRWLMGLLLVTVPAWCCGCDGGKDASGSAGEDSNGTSPATPADASSAKTAAAAEFVLPEVDVSGLPFAIQTKIGAARTVLRRTPDDLATIGELGALYFARGFPQAAAACFTHATEVEPEEYAWWYYLALANEQLGHAKQAADTYEKTLAVQAEYLQQHPEEKQKVYQPARLRLGRLLAQEEPQRAAELFQAVLKRRPKSAAAHFGLAECARVAGRREEAAEHYQRVLERAPDCGPAHEHLADILTARGQTAEAARHRRQAAVNPREPRFTDPLQMDLLRRGLHLEVWLQDAAVLIERGDPERAEQTLRTALEIDASGVRARQTFARLRIAQRRLEDGERLLREALEQRPDSIPLLEDFCTLKRMQNNSQAALPILERALSAKPDNAGVQFQVGSLLFSLGETDKALAAVRKAVELQPDSAAGHYHLGRLLAQKGDAEQARHEWEEALRLRPDYIEPRLDLCNALLDAGQQDAAIAMMRAAVESYPDSPQVHFYFGAILHRTGDTDAARREWTEALRLAPEYPDPRLDLITILWKEKNYAGVEANLRDGLRHAPASPDLANSLAWVLATSPVPEQRRGEEAVTWAEKACKATIYSSPQYLDTLAAACAEAGRFDEARRRIAEAIQLAEAAQLADETLEEFRQRQKLYEQKQPYREP